LFTRFFSAGSMQYPFLPGNQKPMCRFFTTLSILFCFTLNSLAATLRGHVLNRETGEVLTGASIQIAGTRFGDISALDGSFLIHLPAGRYRLMVSMIGYAAETRELSLTETGNEKIAIALSPLHSQLNGITVTTGLAKNTDAGARNIERTASQVMNVVSARAIEISPDITVANVIQRVSGVSVERNSNGDGQYAILRGMDKRYNYTLVNGVKIPSPDNKYRYVPLDIFPAELLDRLEVYKSLTPSMEGDAVGGAVNMVMKEAPAHRLFSVNLGTSYSELFMNRDYMGFRSGGVNKLSPYELHGSGYNATPADFSTATSTYSHKKPAPGIHAGLALGNRLLNNKLGFILAGSLQNTYRGANSLFFASETVDTLKGVTLTSMSNRQYSEQQLRYGLHGKLDYQLSPKNRFSLYNAFINLTNIQTRDVKTTQLAIGGYDPVNGNASLSYSTRSRKTIQHIWNTTLQGVHELLPALKADWSAVYSKATNRQPDNTTIPLNGVEQNFQDTRTTVGDASRRWEYNSDRDLAGYLNFTWLHPIRQLPVEWKLGGLYRDKQRHNFYNNYQLRPANLQAVYGKDFTDYSQIQWVVQNPQGSVASGLNYDASEKISAGYVQFKASLPQLEITGGVRVEHTDQGYAMKFPIGEDNPNGKQTYTDFLPALHAKYMPADKTNIRFSYFRSINRPGFSEIIPTPVVVEEYTERGDPHLRRAVADNLDLRYEYFPRAAEQFMAGIFYKHIKDPIEYTLQAGTTRGQDVYYMPGNFGNATNYGAELDWIRYFSKWGVKANYTYTHSRITTGKSKRIRNSSGDLQTITVNQTRPLYGQSAHIANLSLLYKDNKKGWDAQLAMGYTGPRISTVAQFVDNDLWQKGFVQMDASLEKTFRKRFTVFAKANNLLNTPATIFIKNTSTKNTGVPNQDIAGKTLIRRDYYQRFYMAGLRYQF
jgi:outer membrane cobalamin receptor